MKTKRRMFLLVCAGVLGLVLGGASLAGSSRTSGPTARWSPARTGSTLAPSAYTSNIELAVQQSSYRLGAPANPAFVFFSDPAGNDATAKITIFSPAGYTSSLTQPPGTTVGQAFAIVRAGALGNADLPLSGPVVVANPADLAAQYQLCKSPSDPPVPQEVLVLNTSLQGSSIQVPDFINTAGPYVTQEICLPPPETATFQAKLWYANFTINGIFTNPATSAASPGYQWVADLTPYTGTVPDGPRTVETRTLIGLPSALTLKRVKSKPSQVKFSGRLSIQGVNPAGVRVRVFFGSSQPAFNFQKPGHCIVDRRACPSVLAKAVRSNGVYSLTRRKVKKKTYFQAFLEDGWVLNSGCQGPSPSGQQFPCLFEMLSPMISNQVAVKPPRRRHR